ncbi:MAG: 2Fe-2S iron-sulfur cluster binding domain-containing protein [Candidatus Nitronauta litoralis]|uniref:2Fe-2S iron-sulfur cluster binding domain-containing protein n=1 Tax=Candidatus Nitronauta litoralis TaxID=2705533 RepID=A0A7T0BVB9_9BACT|nr:MAG: 2Fe-2S iron-sulfur cluster binding domain-containing protein [Candidatus Nitronauta litoralis]
METLTTDVTIVGAGPAGCFLSVLLAKSGVNVTLLEQHKTFDREFRGNAFQPSVLRILDQMGLSHLLEELDYEKVNAFEIRDQKGRMFTLPIRDLPPPFNYAIITPQPPLLKRLVEEAGRYPNFRFIADCPVQSVMMEEGAVAGVMTLLQGKPCLVQSRLVVAADGRFSAIRRNLGIELEPSQTSYDFVWFELPRSIPWQNELGLTLDDQGILINIPKERGTSQVGWVIPKGGFARMKQEGLAAFLERVKRVDPELGNVLPDHLKRFDQCSLLDVKIGEATEWVRNGLLLIGDAAHIASPIGGQGNKLAIEDAVLVHPLILKALEQEERYLSARNFREYVTQRRKDINTILNLQKVMGRWIIGQKGGITTRLRRWVLKFLNRSFLKQIIAKNLAMGPHSVNVDSSFQQEKEDPANIFHPLKVKQIIKETARARTIILEIPESLKSVFEYQPGQFLTLRVLNKGILARRAYSLSSASAVDKELSITVKWIVNGNVSTYLVKELKEGDTLWAQPPRGTFVHRPDVATARHHVMFAAGSGIVPIFSMLKSVLETEPESRVTLVYGNHDEASIIYKKELDDLNEKEGDRFRLTHLLQRMDENYIENKLEQTEQEFPDNAEYYTCGPEGMMDEVLRQLKKRKVKSSRIHYEKFVSLYGEEERPGTGKLITGVEVGEPLSGGVVIPETLKVKMNGKVTEVPIRKGETLLHATLRAGIPAPYSCESGVCATCTGRLDEGRVKMEHHDALTDRDLKRKNILACQAVQLTQSAKIDFDVL